MNLGIKVAKLESEPGYIAEVDWTKGDAGQVGTPGAIKYGDSEIEAHTRLKTLLQDKGHTVIESEK
jgi:hypothetical protein